MSFQIGDTIGDYQVIELLGEGGMGKVYKVRNLITDRVEAAKVLLPDLRDQPELADRFMREIKVQASLQHPNIAALHTALRGLSPRLGDDRSLAGDIENVAESVRDGTLVAAVEGAVGPLR